MIGSFLQGLGHEAGDDHAVGTGLAGADGVEEADDDGGETLLLPIGVGEDLVDGLGLGVGPAALEWRTQDAVVVLVEAVGAVLAVDLTARGDEHPGAEFVGLLEDDLRAPDVGGQAAQRLVDDELHAHGGGQMEHSLAAPDDVVDDIGVQDRAEDEFEVGPAQEVLDIGMTAGGEVVQGDDRVASFQQMVSQM